MSVLLIIALAAAHVALWVLPCAVAAAAVGRAMSRR